MKKTYSMPTVAIVNVKLQQMIAGSNPEEGFSKSGAKSLGTDIASGNLSRGGFWDDEEDFD